MTQVRIENVLQYMKRSSDELGFTITLFHKPFLPPTSAISILPRAERSVVSANDMIHSCVQTHACYDRAAICLFLSPILDELHATPKI